VANVPPVPTDEAAGEKQADSDAAPQQEKVQKLTQDLQVWDTQQLKQVPIQGEIVASARTASCTSTAFASAGGAAVGTTGADVAVGAAAGAAAVSALAAVTAKTRPGVVSGRMSHAPTTAAAAQIVAAAAGAAGLAYPAPPPTARNAYSGCCGP
jgi:hypothetical protein